MSAENNDKQCVACQRGSNEIPLITLEYRDTRFWICPQHMPVLIHDPTQLIGMLPGAETMSPADHHD